MNMLEYVVVTLLFISVFLMLVTILLVPIWGMLILVGKTDRHGVFSQRAGMVFMVAMTMGLLLFALAVLGLFLTVPII